MYTLLQLLEDKDLSSGKASFNDLIAGAPTIGSQMRLFLRTNEHECWIKAQCSSQRLRECLGMPCRHASGVPSQIFHCQICYCRCPSSYFEAEAAFFCFPPLGLKVYHQLQTNCMLGTPSLWSSDPLFIPSCVHEPGLQAEVR